ncbi:MAG: 23S rRNA (uracil(1939)-C(5))-methyltransferase RlmD [Elusimicrobia bacterium]|nr:23S rRNA (uracil(1939)-C(5))-methyltransferase RlmD [Elusimicrobiota bacterium]
MTSQAPCRRFGECGGCASQDVPYDGQLEAKSERVAAAFAAAGLDLAPAVRPAPAVWRYRNKLEFAFGDVYPPEDNGPWLRLGFKARKRWNKTVDVGDCLLASEDASLLLARVRAWAEARELPPYNSVKRTGLLRYLVLREAKNTGERMVMLVTTAGDPRLPAAAGLKESFLSALSPVPVTTALWGINAGVSDTAECGSREVLTGEGSITEALNLRGLSAGGDPPAARRSLRFRISPQSFFQTNTLATELLYSQVREWVRAFSPGAVQDLYCGGGGIGLSVADLCGELVGVESNPLGVADAQANAALNGIGNARFVQGLAEAVLPTLPPADAVIVDPPRPGLHPKLLAAAVARPASRLIYVSCNPDALARDLKALGAVYAVSEAAAFDLFPHTPHVETAVLLARRG